MSLKVGRNILAVKNPVGFFKMTRKMTRPALHDFLTQEAQEVHADRTRTPTKTVM